MGTMPLHSVRSTLLCIGLLQVVGCLKFQVSCAKEPYKRDCILQKRPMILRSLPIVATPYIYDCDTCCCGVATISRLLKIMSLLCRIMSLSQGSFAKKSYNFKEPTNRGHPIAALLIQICRVSWLSYLISILPQIQPLFALTILIISKTHIVFALCPCELYCNKNATKQKNIDGASPLCMLQCMCVFMYIVHSACHTATHYNTVAVCSSVLQSVAVSCRVLQRVAVRGIYILRVSARI